MKINRHRIEILKIMKKQSYIAIAAARSGGHIIPGITLAHAHIKNNPETKVLFFSTNHVFDQKIMAEHQHSVHHIALTLDSVPQKWYQYPLFLVQFIGSLVTSMYHLARYRPSCVILMGGYVSIPVCIAALIFRIPRELYELNAVPGQATKLLAPIATKIHVCFEEARASFKAHKTHLSEYPLRFEKPSHSKNAVLNNLQLDSTRTTILILGGSQGSMSLNKVIYRCFQEEPALQSAFNVIHQTGAQDSTHWGHVYHSLGVPAIVFDYHYDLSFYYQATDIVIARAGAGTIFETLFFSKFCILIPLEIKGNDHQLHNARAIAKEHPTMFTVIRTQELSENTEVLRRILTSHQTIQAISIGHSHEATL